MQNKNILLTDKVCDIHTLLTNDIHSGNIEHHVQEISREIEEGFALLRRYPKSVTIFGSSQAILENKESLDAAALGEKIVRDLKYAVITGGGPGIMAAANKGAQIAGGESIGLLITLPNEQFVNGYTTDCMQFKYFFTRKVMLEFAAEAYVFFPGGYGTFDELFNVLVLIQTKKIPRVPVILFGQEYWSPLEDFLKKVMLEKHHYIDARDLELFEITDSLDRVIEIVKDAPVSEWWRHIN